MDLQALMSMYFGGDTNKGLPQDMLAYLESQDRVPKLKRQVPYNTNGAYWPTTNEVAVRINSEVDNSLAHLPLVPEVV